MLDMAEEEEREEAEASKPKRRVQEGSDSAEEDGDSEESDEESSASSADEDDETADPAKIAALQNLIANLPQGDESSRGQAKQRSDGASEYNTPRISAFVRQIKRSLDQKISGCLQSVIRISKSH
jgi:U3 small nucleolar RNA-associated protein 14